MNFLKNFRGVSPIHDFHSHLFANENVSGQHHLGKGSLANAVQQRLITNMALLIGRDGCKVIRHGDFKIKTKTKQNKNTKKKHFLKKQTGNQKKKKERKHTNLSKSNKSLIQRDLIKSQGRRRKGPEEDVAQGNGKQSRMGWLRSWMPPEHRCVRRFEIKEGLSVLLPRVCRDDPAAAACLSQRMVFWMGRNSRCTIGSGWPGRGWKGYSSLGVLERMSYEAEACHSSKIVYILYLLLF